MRRCHVAVSYIIVAVVIGGFVIGSVGCLHSRTVAEAVASNGPVLFVTDNTLRQVRSYIAGKVEPWYSAWSMVEANAKKGLYTELVPYMGSGYLTYFHSALEGAGFARDMGFVYRLFGDERYAKRAKEIMLEYATVENQDPAAEAPINRGLVVARATTTFAYAYSLLYDYFEQDDREILEDWFRYQAGIIYNAHKLWIDNDYFGQQDYQNHLSAHIMGLAIIGYVLRDEAMISYAIDSPLNPRNFKNMIAGAILMPGDQVHRRDPDKTPKSGEVYDRYRTYTNASGPRGLHYAHINSKFLTIVAEVAYNNGRNLYRYFGPNGESLELVYEFYADFYITGDSSIKGGYYLGETVSLSDVHMYELASRRFPNSAKICEVLEKCNRLVCDYEQFGWTSVLIYGLLME
jgi:hypothetical protein